MKKYTSIFFIAMLFLPGIHKVGIVIDFIVRQDYYAEVLCENKDKPQLNCNGKCHLYKQIKNADRQDHACKYQGNSSVVEDNYVYDFFECGIKLPFTKIRRTVLLTLNNFRARIFCEDIFHPPQIM